MNLKQLLAKVDRLNMTANDENAVYIQVMDDLARRLRRAEAGLRVAKGRLFDIGWRGDAETIDRVLRT